MSLAKGKYLSNRLLDRGIRWDLWPDDDDDILSQSDDALVYSVSRTIHTAYFDDSGTRHYGKFLVVAGCVSNSVRWKRLEIEWAYALSKAEVPYFRSAEFFQSTGAFKKWKHDRDAHDDFNKELTRIVTTYVSSIFTVILPLSVWRTTDRQYQLRETGFLPLCVCGLACVEEVREWSSTSKFRVSDFTFVFEQGSQDWGHLKKWANQKFGFELCDGKKEELRPLQVADYLAWQHLQFCRRLSNVESEKKMLESDYRFLPTASWRPQRASERFRRNR